MRTKGSLSKQFSTQYIRRRLLPLLALDLLCLHLAFIASTMLLKYLLGEAFGAISVLKAYAASWWLLSLLMLLIHTLLGLYKQTVRYFDFSDFCRLLLALLLDLLVYTFLSPPLFDARALLPSLTFNPSWTKSLYLQFFLALLLMTGIRVAFQHFSLWLFQWNAGRYLLTKRSLIVGAGLAGQSVAGLLLNEPSQRGVPVAFVDDDPSKQQRKYLGIRVEGTRADIPRLVHDLAIDRIILAIPFAAREDREAILNYCRQTSAEVIQTQWITEETSETEETAEATAEETVGEKTVNRGRVEDEKSGNF